MKALRSRRRLGDSLRRRRRDSGRLCESTSSSALSSSSLPLVWPFSLFDSVSSASIRPRFPAVPLRAE